MTMNNEEVILGYVLKSTPYKEKDAIINVLSEDGIHTFKAKGVLNPASKNASSCLLYSYSEFTVQKSKYSSHLALLKGKNLDSNYKLYDSLDYMCCIGLIVEAILNFLDNPSTFIFESLKTTFKGLNEGFDIFTLTAIMLAKIILETGYGLETSNCVKCGSKTKIVSFSYEEGGFICLKCLSSNVNKDNNDYLKSIRYIFMVDIDNYFHYTLNKKIAIRIIKELMEYIKNQFDFKKLGFYELFLQSY